MFNYLNLQSVPADHGIYIFWSGHFCIYVGKAEKMTLHDRLKAHYNGSHNEDLKLWIKSSNAIEFSYETAANTGAIPAKERNRIKTLAPLTNKLLIRK